jgi:hypothetical protein
MMSLPEALTTATGHYALAETNLISCLGLNGSATAPEGRIGCHSLQGAGRLASPGEVDKPHFGAMSQEVIDKTRMC